MYEAGMNGARINTAYGSDRQHKLIVASVRKAADIPIILDIKGPEIRLHVAETRTVRMGEEVEIGFNDEEIRFNHAFYDEVNVGDKVYIDNGKIRTRVVGKPDGKLRLSVMNDGEISDGKGVNIPNKMLAVPTLSRKDYKLLDFACDHEVEYIALSFTRNIKDVQNLQSRLQGFNGAIIAKIENSEGVKNFEAILGAVDSIMIARGDLGVEIEPERVPLLQKWIIKQCNQQGKPAITATEMLESMIHRPTPTRAEVSDVANAILDGTDAIMLSGETSIGQYPVESVSMMSRIAHETETSVESNIQDNSFTNISDTVSRSIHRICQSMAVSKVVTLTRSGYTAKMLARFRITPTIIAVTPSINVKRQLELVFGVHPVHFNYQPEEDRILAVTNKLRSASLVDDDDTVVFTAAFRTSLKHASNLIEIHKIRELVESASSKD
jgi:pyruvate kinase